MFDKIYYSLYHFVRRRRFLVLAIIGAVVILSASNLPRIKYDNDIEAMLPAGPEILRDIRFLREAGFSDKVIISLGLTSLERSTDELIAAADQLAGSLPGPLVTSVSSGLMTGNLREEIRAFLKLSPQIIPASDLRQIDEQLTQEGVDAALRLNYNRLLTPAGEFFAPFIREDPLGLRNKILARLQNLSSSVGPGVVVEKDHFLSSDGRNALLVIDTPVSVTEGFGCRKLIEHLKERIKILPGYVQAKIISGHLHSVSNEDVIKQDILRTTTIATVAFILIFLLAFRDIRALIFFLIPLAAVIVSINLASFVFPALSYFVIGMGAVIVGIADDYGIHVYVAVHTTQKRDAVSRLMKPLMIAALTTTSVFTAFFFSNVKGYHQLAFFASLSIFFCLGFVLFVLPHFLKEGGKGIVSPRPERVPSVRSDRSRIFAWLVVLSALLFFSTRLRFSSDITQFDGSRKEVFAAEEEFKRTWGIKEYPAMLVSLGKDEEEAVELAESVVKEVGWENLVNFVSLWPSAKTRAENALAWEKFWRQGREVRLGMLIDWAGAKYNFSKDAFKPFFDGLYEGLNIGADPGKFQFFKRLKERFVIEKPDGVRVISFFPDEEEYLLKMRSVNKEHPGAFVVSRNSLSRAISTAIAGEILFLSAVAAALILILTFVLLKDFKLTLISLVSVVSAVIAVCGIFAMLGRPMNAASLIASMVVVGLCIDYGVFMLYSYQHALQIGTVKAIWMSAATTLVGAFSLLFASHPVLFSIGLTLVSGLLAGFVSSQFILPALYRAWVVRRVWI
ncbi:MAG: MMPL family transporter [Candidatus Omnitrophota bacterium]